MAGRRKDTIRNLLEARDLPGLVAWVGNTRRALQALFGQTYDEDPLIRWRAIEAVGVVAGKVAESEPERLKDFIRRLLWLMNDESGGLGWMAPEAIGEVLVAVPSLRANYSRLFVHFLVEEPFEKGSRHAIFRLGGYDPKPFLPGLETLRSTLDDPDPAMRGLSLLALAALVPGEREALAVRFADDHETLPLYGFDTGLLEDITVARAAGRL